VASKSEIRFVRDLTNTTAEDFSDDEIGALLDPPLSLSQNAAAASIWRQLAAKTAKLVDTSESGSSRQLSQIHKHAMGMASHFQDLANAETVEEVTTTRGRPVSRPIERV
jgi:plasmid stabilization system protein ParE